MIKEFKADKYYLWIGSKERPFGWNYEGRMDFLLDGKPHKCKEGNIHYASFYDCDNQNRKWKFDEDDLYNFVEVVMHEEENNKEAPKQTSSPEALEKSIVHWENITKALSIVDIKEEKFPSRLSGWLKEKINEGLTNVDCALCIESGYDRIFDRIACSKCVLSQNGYGCLINGSPYQAVVYSESWEEALKASRNMLKVLRSLRKKI